MNIYLELMISAVIAYSVLILYVRLVGLRSFSQLTALDFAVTVAIGTTLASTILPSKPTMNEGLFLLGVFLFIQWVVSVCRRKIPFFQKIVENQPVLLMENGQFLEDNIKKTNMTKDDLIAKLREANVFKLSEVRAVVFESTGDVSVLHGSSDLDNEILEGVSKN